MIEIAKARLLHSASILHLQRRSVETTFIMRCFSLDTLDNVKLSVCCTTICKRSMLGSQNGDFSCLPNRVGGLSV
jgi:hypothetical protein